MGSNRSSSSPQSYWKQRIPAPPAAARFDAAYVHAVADLAAVLRLATPTPAPSDEPA